VGDCAAVFRAVAERDDVGEGEFPIGDPDGVQFPVGGGAVDLSVFSSERARWREFGIAGDEADQSGGDGRGGVAGPGGVDQRIAEKVSEVLRVPGLHPVQQLFHDHNLCDAVADQTVSPGLDVGAAAGDRDLCGAGVAGAAFRVDAGQEQVVISGQWPVVKRCGLAVARMKFQGKGAGGI
jgi:hypothetical protein